MPESMTLERRKLLAALGAEIILTPAHLGMTGALAKVEELKKQLNVFVPQQFNNPANPQIHYNTTAPEIFKDTNGEVDVGCRCWHRRNSVWGVALFKEHKPKTQIVAVEPQDSAVLSGNQPGPHMIQGIGAGFVPGNISSNDYHQQYR